MTALLNRLGDRLLGAVLPRATASACTVWANQCRAVYQECYAGATCTTWYQCHNNVDGAYCHVDAPGSYDYNYRGCC
ncbi:hypothetical protein ACTMTJ_08150 [Phytohabitans sp. LJ34]|uniref:hypothetical protein n=1 Tax=Phytohabitans sp. LJ34 TaxID=3452217 RepID=UPI003F8AD311